LATIHEQPYPLSHYSGIGEFPSDVGPPSSAF